jgi:hypothetical protein
MCDGEIFIGGYGTKMRYSLDKIGLTEETHQGGRGLENWAADEPQSG